MPWDDLLSILAEAQADRAASEDRAANPVECPQCGWSPLREGPDGQPYCEYDGWRKG